MKKFFYLCVFLLSINSIFYSCRDDNNDINYKNGFTFKIERDTDFSEKPLGEVNKFKFNITTDYDFSKIPHFFKFTSVGQGSLTLNGEILEPNVEYPLKTYNNVFEYVGNEQGTHKIKIITRNDKGYSNTEEFSFGYGISDFDINVVKPTKQIYQGQYSDYVLRIKGTKKIGRQYYIRFDSYEGNEIKLNGKISQTGQFYPIQQADLENIKLSLKSNKSGRNILTYTIKNETVTKENNEIAQEILPRAINIFNLETTKNVLDIGDQFEIIGVLNKTPNDGNKLISYRSWISKGLSNGITSTNGNWIDNYQLGNSNNFSGIWTAKLSGKYEYNIQFKDEYGNESEIRTYEIIVNEPLRFVGEVKGIIVYSESYDGDFEYIKSVNLVFNAKGSKNKKIVKYEAVFKIKYEYPGFNGYLPEKKEEIVTMKQTFDIPKEEININTATNKNLPFNSYNATYIIKVTDTEGNIITKEGKTIEVKA